MTCVILSFLHHLALISMPDFHHTELTLPVLACAHVGSARFPCGWMVHHRGQVGSLVKTAYARAKQLILDNQTVLTSIAQRLVEKETVRGCWVWVAVVGGRREQMRQTVHGS